MRIAVPVHWRPAGLVTSPPRRGGGRAVPDSPGPCQAIAQPGPDGFTIPGIADTIPLMLPNYCYPNTAIIATHYPELDCQEGILPEPAESARLACFLAEHPWWPAFWDKH